MITFISSLQLTLTVTFDPSSLLTLGLYLQLHLLTFDLAFNT